MAFKRGDLVHIAKDLGQSMAHFTADVDAIVIGSYRDQFGGGSTNAYTVYLEGRGQCSWYDERQLTLIESGRGDLLAEWEAQAAIKRARESDLDWIFANGPEVLKHPSGASVQALAKGLGCHDIWGLSGEGMTYVRNMVITLQRAAPFLESGDKAGWLAHCADQVAKHGEIGPKPYPRPRVGIQAAIDMIQMHMDGDHRHPLAAAKEIGLEWTDAESQPIADQWMLYGIKSLPAEVPKWLRVVLDQ